jgi:integrase
MDIIHQFTKFVANAKGFPLHSTSPFFGDEPAVSFPRSTLRRSPGRPTPSVEEAERIADILAENSDPYLSVRDFLLCQWKIQVGLRDQGLQRMTLACLQHALHDEGILLAGGNTIATLSKIPEQQQEVFRRLHELADKGRTYLILEVIEKGQKPRKVPVPITLMIMTLEFVWNERAELIDDRRNSWTERSSAGSLWLSKKTGSAISAQAIGRLLKEAFKQGGVSGSGHRLRALFANNLVRRLYLEARALRGEGWDASSVLFEAAEILGHNHIETMRPYLNRVRREEQVLNSTVDW